MARYGVNPSRILYLSPYYPHRSTCASELRALHIARALQECAEVEVVVVGGEGRGREWAERAEKEFNVAYNVPVYPFPNKRLREKAEWVVNPRVNYPHGVGVDAHSLARVVESARRCDLVWFCKLRTPNMFPCWAWRRSVADIDDVPSMYERTMWANETRLGGRGLAALRFLSWRRRDQRLGERFTVLGVCSDADKRYLRRLGVKRPMHVIPNGFDRPPTEPVRKLAKPPRIGFIGILDYEPNLEGIRWFVGECWPRIKQEVPDACLRLVGRYSDSTPGLAGPGIDGLGFVADAAGEIATWSAMVVPIRVGAGTRGKIAHAFSLRCPVVSTSLGAYGYDALDGREMFLADSAEDFASACIRTIRRPAEAAGVAERAWTGFLKSWTWDAIRPRIRDAVEECLRLSSAERRSEGR